MRALLCCGIVLPLASVLAGAAAQPTELATLVDRAAAYVKSYQEELTSVVADETYTQHIRAQIPRDKGAAVRSLRSEIFFMFTPGDWMAIRDVVAMDGRELKDRPDLKLALQMVSTPEVARKFKSYNSRFNLGRVVRNFNEPTLSLLPLDANHRSRFAFEERRRHGGLVVLAFRERSGPTLVSNLAGGDVASQGEYTIEPDTGRIRRAMLVLPIGSVTMTFTTMYEHDPRLEMLVPVRFGEHYRDGKEPDKPSTAAHRRRDVVPLTPPYYEDIVCEARYVNFRRFEVKARIR